MNSYVLKKFNCLSDNDKAFLYEKIRDEIQNQKNERIGKRESTEKLLAKTTLNIKEIFQLPDYIFPIKYKYELFNEILCFQGDFTFNTHTILNYQEKIIKMRNKVAHKKLDICKQQKYLKCCNNIDQLEQDQCTMDCSNHSDERKITFKEWEEVLKLTNEYSKLFDKVLTTLTGID